MSENNSMSQERINQKLSTASGTKGKKGILFAIVIVCILAAVVLAVVLLVPSTTKEQEQRSVMITPDNVDEVMAEMAEPSKIGPGQYEVVMNTSWEFENGTSASTNAYVENSTANSNDIYFDVTLNDTGETIYESPVIPVGSHLDEITLDTALNAGEYECTLTYYLLNEDGEPVSTLDIVLRISVMN